MNRYVKDYLPTVFSQFREFLAITESEQPQVEELYKNTNRVLDEQFINTAENYGLSRWERILGITTKSSETNEERRFRILVFMVSQLPYTQRALENRLRQLCGEDGFSVEIDVGNFTVKVLVALEAGSSYDVIKKLLDKMVPANMYINLSLKYNQYSQLTNMTQNELAAFTHYQIRNEVFG